VDKIAQVHGASDSAILLTTSSRLTKVARKWFDIQEGPALETWHGLKEELTKVFEKRVSFYKTMQMIEARKWQPAKESLDRAIEKMVMMVMIRRLNLPPQDAIQLEG